MGDPERRMLQLLELEEESTSRSRQKPYWRPPANEKLLSVNESLGKKKIKNASRVVAASVCVCCVRLALVDCSRHSRGSNHRSKINHAVGDVHAPTLTCHLLVTSPPPKKVELFG